MRQQFYTNKLNLEMIMSKQEQKVKNKPLNIKYSKLLACQD